MNSDIDWQNGMMLENGEWQDVNWAYGCKFDRKPLTRKLSTSTLCSQLCSEIEDCTHFTWNKYRGGTCWMQTGVISKIDAIEVDDKEVLCGIIPEKKDSNCVGVDISSNIYLEENFDWRTNGRVTPVKDQTPCNSWYINLN